MILEKNFLVDFSDPHIKLKGDKYIQKIFGRSKLIKINKNNLLNYDCVILVTDHDDFDYKLITRYSKILIDTRNRISRKQNFYKL